MLSQHRLGSADTGGRGISSPKQQPASFPAPFPSKVTGSCRSGRYGDPMQTGRVTGVLLPLRHVWNLTTIPLHVTFLLQLKLS